MIHLFNNVFLEQDTLVNAQHKHVIISSTYATPDTALLATSLASGTTLEVVLAGKTLEEFLKSLMVYGEEKVMIFADNAAFAAVAASWLKSSTNMDQEAFNTIVDCYKHKYDVLGRPDEQLSEVMKAAWPTAIEGNYSAEQFKPSFEFSLASAFVNREFSKKSQLKNLLSLFIKREYEHLILEARQHLDTYILDRDLQALLGGSNKTIQNFRELPRMSIYREPFYKEALTQSGQAYLTGWYSKLDISNGTSAEITELCTLTDDINMAVMNNSSPAGLSGTANSRSTPGWEYMVSVRNGTITDTEYNNILDEMLAEKIAMIHVPYELQEQILFVFLPYIKSLKQDNNMSLLQKFTLK